ncbi:src like adaptor 1a [Neoarius graeffei]|uniref:src like adaptor 1a n=1 Tax=Neoarius graeffei TaxID=443677 RepID=UPI00298C97CB|nr:src like adaptor 1a [Neoarius graeffei]
MGNIIKGHVTETHTATSQLDASFKATDDDNLVVISDYPCRGISEPMFRMGEKLKGLSQEASWWKVCSLQTGTENYIPKNHVAKVYHGWLFEGVGRQKAEELLYLPGNTVGSFLIRESPNQRGVYSLSVRHRAIKHYKIFRLDNSWYYISPRLTFQCLEDMVNHYSDSSDGICCILSAPCLAFNSTAPSSVSQAPPVVMRRNFTWRKVNHSQLVNSDNQSTADSRHSMVSYGVRSSIAAYLSIAEEKDRKSRRKKKGWTVYGMPDNSNMERENTD